MKVAIMPKGPTLLENPYKKLLSNEIKKFVDDLVYYSTIKKKTDVKEVPDILYLCDVYHFGLVNYKNPSHALGGIKQHMRILDYLRDNGTKVVWTNHGMFPIGFKYTEIEKFYWNQLSYRIDGVAGLEKEGLKMAFVEFPHLDCPSIMLNHGDLTKYYGSMEDVEPAFDFEEDTWIFLGQIRDKKDVLNLVKSFKDYGKDKLIIAGKVNESRSEVSLESKIRSEINSDRIIFHPYFVSKKDVLSYYKSADYGLVPQSLTMTSGALYTQLGFGIPCLTTDVGAFREIQSRVGKDFMYIGNKRLQPRDFQEAKDYFKRTELKKKPLIKDWEDIANNLVEFFHELV